MPWSWGTSAVRSRERRALAHMPCLGKAWARGRIRPCRHRGDDTVAPCLAFGLNARHVVLARTRGGPRGRAERKRLAARPRRRLARRGRIWPCRLRSDDTVAPSGAAAVAGITDVRRGGGTTRRDGRHLVLHIQRRAREDGEAVLQTERLRGRAEAAVKVERQAPPQRTWLRWYRRARTARHASRGGIWVRSFKDHLGHWLRHCGDLGLARRARRPSGGGSRRSGRSTQRVGRTSGRRPTPGPAAAHDWPA